MFQYCSDIFKRHKKKFLFSTGLIAVSYVASTYITSKINQFQEKLKEENFAKEQIKRRFKQTQNDCYMTFLSLLPVLTEPIYELLNVEDITKQLQLKRQERLKSNNLTSISNDPALSSVLSDDFSTHSQIEKEVKQPISISNSNSNKSKTQLWNDLKIESLTRFLTLLYCESLLIIFLHLQLNILSRKSYLETALKLASKSKGIKLENESGISLDSNYNLIDDDDLSTGSNSSESNLNSNNSLDDDNNLPEQAFLSFSWWLLNKGWLEIKSNVEQSIEDVFGEINPRQELSIDDFASLINRTQQIIDKNLTISNTDQDQDQDTPLIVSSLLPPSNLEFFLLQQTNDLEFLSNFNNNILNFENLNKLLIELKNYLLNDQINSIISLLVNVGISKILDNIVLQLLNKNNNNNNNTQEIQIQDDGVEKLPKIKLASLLALITKQSNQLSNNSLDNDILYTLNNLQELDDLSASVYSNFDAQLD
ncbi:hypothetical protein CANARDRAFT_210343 [[Candida] arabinofermentans NRRL YB-2248]|uniref:Peroxin-3 n=1 Tax=[Candida] arabinofermentans NRRL YB-2248 TaxID=983967 RepID=A0A1E4T8J8_9ASCO|nr:hypothetical protein CANARDRAFT_210343 [[Candida] arabinofermentans NRRL YB-2248]